MIEVRQGQAIPTTLGPGDHVHYSQEYEWVKFTRGVSALRYDNGDDKEPLLLLNHADFKSFCTVLAHVCGLSIVQWYTNAPANKIWRCAFGVSSQCKGNILLQPDDVIRYDMSQNCLEFLRADEPFYTSMGGMLLGGDNFIFFSQILSNVCGLGLSGVDIDSQNRDIWSFTLLRK